MTPKRGGFVENLTTPTTRASDIVARVTAVWTLSVKGRNTTGTVSFHFSDFAELIVEGSDFMEATMRVGKQKMTTHEQPEERGRDMVKFIGDILQID